MPSSIAILPTPIAEGGGGENYLPGLSERSANAIRDINVDAFRRSTRYDRTMVFFASNRPRQSTASEGDASTNLSIDQAESHHEAVSPTPAVVEQATRNEKVAESPPYSPMSIDPKTGEAQNASWPRDLPAREAGNAYDTPTRPSNVPIAHATHPQIHRRFTIFRPLNQTIKDGSITPLRSIFRQLHIPPPPPSPFSLGVIVQHKQTPTISPLARGLVVPSAPPSRGIVMPQLNTCQNFLLAKRCQASQRKTTRDHNLALFVLAQRSNQKLVILNDDTPPPAFLQRVTRPGTAQSSPGTRAGGRQGPVGRGQGQLIPTFFQPGQALYPMNAVGSYVQPLPNPFYGDQPNISPQQSDANFFLRQNGPPAQPFVLPSQPKSPSAATPPPVQVAKALTAPVLVPVPPPIDSTFATSPDLAVATPGPSAEECVSAGASKGGIKRKRGGYRRSVSMDQVDEVRDLLFGWGEPLHTAEVKRKRGRGSEL